MARLFEQLRAPAPHLYEGLMQDNQTGEGDAVEESTHPVPNHIFVAMLYDFIVPRLLTLVCS
jgi:UTP-glucose-1-phosphate uridylyltransferase